MSRYNVNWDKEAFTLTITEGTEPADNTVGQVVYGAVGEVPESAAHPQVDQHLRNIALQQGVDDYSLVTVVNDTDNARLDKFVRNAEKDNSVRMPQREDMLVKENDHYTELQNNGPDQTPIDPATGEAVDTKDTEQASDTKPEIVTKSDVDAAKTDTKTTAAKAKAKD